MAGKAGKGVKVFAPRWNQQEGTIPRKGEIPSSPLAFQRGGSDPRRKGKRPLKKAKKGIRERENTSKIEK